MSGNLGTQFKGLVVESTNDVLLKNNVANKAPVETNVVTNDLLSQTINIGYSIHSTDPTKVNKAIQSNKYKAKKVFLTKSMDCTIRGELQSGYVQFWKTSDDILPFRKIIYSGIKTNEVSNNFQLWNEQLAVMEKIISNWASKTAYSGSFVSSLVSLNMSEYDITFNDPTTEKVTRYKTNTCEELLRILKIESGLPLVNISSYDSTTCSHVPWTAFNKKTLHDLMVSVNGIVNSPKAVPRDGENYISTLPTPPSSGYSPDEFAYNVYETANYTASNYIRLMHTVFVDAFEPIDDVPTLLQLVFYTDFFFEMKPEEEPVYGTGGSITKPTLYNPDIMVKAPLESSQLN